MKESEGGERKVDSRQTEVEGKEEKKSRDFLGTALVIGQSAGPEIVIRTELAGFNREKEGRAGKQRAESLVWALAESVTLECRIQEYVRLD